MTTKAAEKEVLDVLERMESRISWESQIELLENLQEFIEEHLDELRGEDHA